jgi:hypothetical protein
MRHVATCFYNLRNAQLMNQNGINIRLAKKKGYTISDDLIAKI